ncbi:MAG: SlyX family protein [Bacteriovoracaceae bacterium]
MTSDDRITELEIRFSHQDHYLQQLNEVIVNQQKTIERLEKEVLDLKRSMNSTSSVTPIQGMKDDKPPHY